MSGRERRAYGEELMATADDEWMRKQARSRVIGSAEFAGKEMCRLLEENGLSFTRVDQSVTVLNHHGE